MSNKISSRLQALDVARALAIWGMVIVNFSLVLVKDFEQNTGLAAGLSQVLQGRAVALFIVLAGYGIGLMSANAMVGAVADQETAPRNAVRPSLLKRALFLLISGLLFVPIWPADILHFYGFYIALSVMVLFANRKILLALAFLLPWVFLGLMAIWDWQTEWDFDTLSYAGFWTLAGFTKHVFFNGFHPVIPWVGFLLFGLAMARFDLTKAKIRHWAMGGSAAMVLALFGISKWVANNTKAITDPETRELIDLLAGFSPLPPLPFYMFSAGASALFVIAFLVQMEPHWKQSLFWKFMIPSGQLALSLYFAHVLIGLGLPDAFGGLGQWSVNTALGWAVLFCGIGGVGAMIWRKYFARGPVESLMRRLCG